MSMNWRKGFVFALFGLLITTSYADKSKDLYHRAFWQPYYHGQRLAWCAAGGQECGPEVANQYCKMMGYERSDKQIISNNVGLANYISSAYHCKGWRCDGFKLINCVDKIAHKPASSWHYRLRHFTYPRFNNYRVDWCYDGKKGCGRKAAFSFCRRMGFLDVRHYAIQRNIPATKAIGNQKLCFGQSCRAFSYIDCFR